jgi:hypothetical protein|nr:MAG TPA: hypothetical protein [Caudoviricetes sp.]
MKLQFVGDKPRVFQGSDGEEFDTEYHLIYRIYGVYYHPDSGRGGTWVIVSEEDPGFAIEYDSEKELFEDWVVVEATLDEIKSSVKLVG